MTYEIIDQFIFALLIVFCRIGSICMFLPVIGESTTPVRIKLVFAILLSFIIMPTIHDKIPMNSSLSTAKFALLIFNEITLGLVIGIAVKTIQSALHVMGMVFAFQSGLSSAMLFDPTQNTQGSLYGNLLSLTFIVVLIVSDLHIEIIRAMKYSYEIFELSAFSVDYNSFINLIIRICADTFNVGIRLSAPYLLIGILCHLGAGILSRLMPQMQIFFVLLPAQIMIQTIIFLATFSASLLWFVDYYQQYLKNIFG